MRTGYPATAPLVAAIRPAKPIARLTQLWYVVALDFSAPCAHCAVAVSCVVYDYLSLFTSDSTDMSFLQTLNTRTTRTFKPRTVSSKQKSALQEYATATLGSDALQAAVKLPPGEDENEWIAVHVVDFYNQINMLYATINKLCTARTCPKMIATEEYEYLWQDSASEEFKKPTRLSAAEYIEHLMAWIQRQFDNPDYFPTSLGVEFGKGAHSTFKQILKRLFRVYAHIYCHHFEQMTEVGLQPHLNTSLKHFVLFCNHFELVDRAEYGPLTELLQLLERE